MIVRKRACYAGAAAQHLGLDLAASVCAMFNKPLTPAWAPRIAPA